jgi:predicted aspartyl protease
MEPKPGLDRIPDGAQRKALEDFLGRAAMGEVRAKVRLENHDDKVLHAAGKVPKKRLRARTIEAVVDMGAVLTLLPQDLVEALGLEVFDRTVVQLANDQKIELSVAGPVTLTVAGRAMMTDCLVGPPGCEALLGQIVMERLDLIVDPARRTLTVRPESPYKPTLKLRGLQPVC